MSDQPINWQKGIKHYGGDEDMFRLMIERFEEITFNQSLATLYQHIMTMDIKNIKENAHTIMGASRYGANSLCLSYSYLAADKCEETAKRLEASAIKEDRDAIIQDYLSLMKDAKALKIHIAKLTNKQPTIEDIEKYGKTFIAMYFLILSFPNRSNILESDVRKKYQVGTSLSTKRSGKSYTGVMETDKQVDTSNPNNAVCCTNCNIF